MHHPPYRTHIQTDRDTATHLRLRHAPVDKKTVGYCQAASSVPGQEDVYMPRRTSKYIILNSA